MDLTVALVYYGLIKRELVFKQLVSKCSGNKLPPTDLTSYNHLIVYK